MTPVQEQIRKDFDELVAERQAGMFKGKGGLCECIRTAVSLNPEATLEDFCIAIPEVNRQTAYIQFRQSRKLDAELYGA